MPPEQRERDFHSSSENRRPYRVLFLCTGNSARSQMAQAWARQLAEDGCEFYSAGTWPSRHLDTRAAAVMLEKGIDISGSKPKPFTAIPKPLDLVVAVCGQAAENLPRVAGAEVEQWHLPDPAKATGTPDMILEAYRETRDAIEERVRDLVQRRLNVG